jgi:UDP-N-acetylglucosamine 2-epimerase (non-hydrolysing)
MKKVLVCWGTRPEVIKLAPLVQGLKKSLHFKPIILNTGQHLEMVQQAMRLFGLRANYDLKVMTSDQMLSSLSRRILEQTDKILKTVKPVCVMVQGDTTTAFLAGLTAFYQKIPVGHVEAGLRSDNKYHPFPEEINRRLISQLADYHFAPTQTAAKRLVQEGISKEKVLCTGNTGIDALLEMKRRLTTKKAPVFSLPSQKRIVLITAHRRESFGAPFKDICRGILKIAKAVPNAEFYYPVHLNPQVQSVVHKMLGKHKQIHLLKPLAYDELVYLMVHADLILTDSGGIQEEAPSFHKPILVLRSVTERPEGIRAGFARVVGQDPDRILKASLPWLVHPEKKDALRQKKNPYGDGKAAQRIVKYLQKQPL